jgi:hemerythrin-like domain-containing protein
MKATEILMDEHRVIERVLRVLEIAASRLSEGLDIRPGFFIEAADFIKGFADGCHHMKEEGVLFKAMVSAGMPLEGGPISVMLMEHEQGRVYTRAMRAAAEKMKAGDFSVRQAVVDNALGYVALLRQHINKENSILFPMADRVIPTAHQSEVEEGFEHVEHEETGEGVHEKYLAMAEAMEKEILG